MLYSIKNINKKMGRGSEQTFFKRGQYKWPTDT